MRSKLFVPASREDLFSKAFSTSADGICFDLEDGVKPQMRAKARSQLRHFLCQMVDPKGKKIIVRINQWGSKDSMLDLDAIILPGVNIINLPKVDSTQQIKALSEVLTYIEQQRHITQPIAILATIETEKGLRLAQQIIGASPRLIGLQLGFADLLEPLGILAVDQQVRQHIRLVLRLAVAEYNLAVWDSAWPDIQDKAGFIADAQCARLLGFSGKSCIHPSQIQPVNQIFCPTEDEIMRAERIISAAKKSDQGVTMLDGQMIDLPYIRRATMLLNQLAQDQSNDEDNE